MTKRFAFLAAATALASAVAVPVLSAPAARFAAHALETGENSSSEYTGATVQLVEDREGGWRKMWWSGGDDDDDDDDDDEGGRGAGMRNPAALGDVAPPDNGLFNKGAKPSVQVN